MEKGKVDIVTLVLVCLVILLGGYIISSRSHVDYNQSNHRLDSLNQVMSRLQREQLESDSILRMYEMRYQAIELEKQSLSKELEATRQFYGKAIRDIGKLSTAQLDSFFTDRYDRTRLQHR